MRLQKLSHSLSVYVISGKYVSQNRPMLHNISHNRNDWQTEVAGSFYCNQDTMRDYGTVGCEGAAAARLLQDELRTSPDKSRLNQPPVTLSSVLITCRPNLVLMSYVASLEKTKGKDHSRLSSASNLSISTCFPGDRGLFSFD